MTASSISAVDDEGALGRDRGAGEKQIAKRADQGESRGDLLARQTQGKRRYQSQGHAHREEQGAGDQGRDAARRSTRRCAMPAIAHGAPDRIRHRAAQPGEQRHRDAAGWAGDGCPMILPSRSPGAAGPRPSDQPRSSPRGATRSGLPRAIADRAELHEVGLAGEVEAMRLARRRGRHEQRAQAHAIARTGPAAARCARSTRSCAGVCAASSPSTAGSPKQQTPPRARSSTSRTGRLDQVGAAPLEDWRRDQLGAKRGRPSARGDRRQAEQRRQAPGLMARRRRRTGSSGGPRRARAARSSAGPSQTGGSRRQPEVEADAEPDADRQPEQPALALGQQPGREPRARPRPRPARAPGSGRTPHAGRGPPAARPGSGAPWRTLC